MAGETKQSAAREARTWPGSGEDAIVVGAGLAGLTAAISLARAGARVRVIESREHIGGRWGAGGSLERRTPAGAVLSLPVEYGLHGIWRRYVNLRALIESVGASDSLRIAEAQELVIARGDGSPGFIELGRIVRTTRLPHFAASGAMAMQREWLKHPGMLRGLGAVAQSMTHVLGFDPQTDVARYDEVSVAQLIEGWPRPLNRLFRAMSYSGFFAQPEQVSLSAFMTGLWFYAVADRRDCGFHVLDDVGSTVVLGRLVAELEQLGGRLDLATAVDRVIFDERGRRPIGVEVNGTRLKAEAVILAVDPSGMKRIAGEGPLADLLERYQLPKGLPSVSVRLFTRSGPGEGRAATGMFGDGDADNFFWLHRVLTPYERWHAATGQGVLELHLYGDKATSALARPEHETLAAVVKSVRWAFPEAGEVLDAHININPSTHVAFAPGTMSKLPPIRLGPTQLALCGDWIDCPVPAMYLERACTTGLLAAQSVATAAGVSPTDLIQPIDPPIVPRSVQWTRRAHRLAHRFGFGARL